MDNKTRFLYENCNFLRQEKFLKKGQFCEENAYLDAKKFRIYGQKKRAEDAKQFCDNNRLKPIW